MPDELRRIVESSRRIVFFGGAGVSTASGVPDFRSASGLYTTTAGTAYPPEVILSRTFFDSHPELFYGFYRNAMLYPDARPNAAHYGLAAIEAAGRLAAVITQNIDGLHAVAGSAHVLELHGSVHRNTCRTCHATFGLAAVTGAAGIPRCACGGMIKPDIVLYEEALDQRVLAAAAEAVNRADTLIVGGTSLVVYPAAGLVQCFRGKNFVMINRDATDLDHLATLVIREPLEDVLGVFAADPPSLRGRKRRTAHVTA